MSFTADHIIGVIGAGTMGRGIAQIAALHGHRTVLVERDEDTLLAAREQLDHFIQRLSAKGKISDQDAVAAFGNLHFSTDLSAVKDAGLIIEAIVESLEVKQSVFKQLEEIVSKECILASNTSSLSITSIARALEAPDRCIGLHFFNPAPLMKLVEIIPALQTAEACTMACTDLITAWGKVPVVAKDTPAFIVNRIARPFYSEAIRIYEEGMAEPIDIDRAMTQKGGFRMGPFALMDYIGHDVNYKVTETVFEAFFYDSRFVPSFSQKRLVEAGYLGRKSGKGFYDYREDAEPLISTASDQHLQDIADRIIVMLINAAYDALHYGVASRDDIELAMTKGVNYPKGLLAWAADIGLQECVDHLDELYDFYHEDRYRCCARLRADAVNSSTSS